MNDVPPAFRPRRPQPPRPASFTGMEDEQVLRIAANALRMVTALPIGSLPRDNQWASFNQAMSELGSRAITHALDKIWEIHEREGRGKVDGGGRPAIEPGDDAE